MGACALLLAGCCSMAHSAAHAGNQDPFFLSNDAALTAGAVVALPGDLGAPWYNPAGLASIPRASVDISASAFVLRLQDLPGALETILPDGTAESQDLQNTQFVSVPTSLVFARRLSPKLALAFGVFVPSQESTSLGTDTQTAVQPQRDDTEYRQDLQLDAQVTRTHLGPSVAYSLSPDLRLGASLFGVYRLADLTSQHWAGYKGNPRGAAFGLQQEQSTSTGLGLEANLGAQWNPTAHLHLGLAARSPLALLKLWTSSETLSVRATDPRNDGGSLLLDPLQAEAAQGAQLIAPARVHLAAGWLQGGLWLGAEADLTLPLNNQELGVQTRAIWNARLGARAPASPNVVLGGGLFTDRAIAPEPDALGELRVDYYGASFGAQWSTPYALAPSADGPDELTLSTTASLRYAIGVGQAGGLRFEPAAPQGQLLSDRLVDVTFHELGLHLGSTISF